MNIRHLNIYSKEIFANLTIRFNKIFEKRDLVQEFADNPFLNFLIIDINQEFIGFLEFNMIYDKIEINNINILDKYQQKGYASMLMENLLQLAIDKDIYNITLEVNQNNYKAINLYKKYSFKQVATRKNYYNDTDGILMERKMK